MRHQGKRGLHFLVGRDIQQNGEVPNFGHEWGELYPHPIPHKKHPEQCAWSEYLIILKRVRESIFSFKATNLQHVRLEMEKR